MCIFLFVNVLSIYIIFKFKLLICLEEIQIYFGSILKNCRQRKTITAIVFCCEKNSDNEKLDISSGFWIIKT